MADTNDPDLARINAEGDANAARIAARRQADQMAKMPREALVALVTGISILVLMLTLAIWSYASHHWLTGSDTAAGPGTAPPPAPARPPRATSDDDDHLVRKPRSGGGGGGGGGGAVGGGAADDTPEPASPIAAGPLAVLKGLRALLYQASHSPQSAIAASNVQDVGAMFPPGTLDDAGSDVVTNLQLAALRVAHNPVLGIRVLGKAGHMAGASYEIEVMSSDRSGGEIVSRSRVTIEPTASGGYRLARLDALEPFDSPEEGGSPATAAAPASPGQPVAVLAPPRVGSAPVGVQAPTFPYVIR